MLRPEIKEAYYSVHIRQKHRAKWRRKESAFGKQIESIQHRTLMSSSQIEDRQILIIADGLRKRKVQMDGWIDR